MIAAQELRIGNKAYESSLSNAPETDYQVITIAVINSIDNVIRDSNDNIYQPEYLYPIPLTPEIMQKIGAVRRNATQQGEVDSYYINGFWITVDYCLIFNDRTIPMPNLHQLQNGYYTIRGKELEINL